MRAARTVRRIHKVAIAPQTARNLTTTPKIRPVVVEGAQCNRLKSEVPKRHLASSSRAEAGTSPSHAQESIGADAEVKSPELDVSGLPTSTDLLEVYRGMVARGRLAYDPEQVRIVMKVRHSGFAPSRLEWG